MYQPVSFRNLKIASVLNKAIMQLFIKEYSDLSRIISVSEVKVSDNAKNATVLIVISKYYNDNVDIIKELNDCSYVIRKAIFNYVQLRYVPRLYFKLDYKFNYFTKINNFFINENLKDNI
ncbi:ribosome-binding factor A [Neoehrlichia mikurensis]|uniref:Ribosome-binding factor A n=1 Tax=Neoehrlichia mikurensis TaxID=89586 RepID=A0A9Q9BYZ2_9RICK|nr:ribosome-binding factor A [Neoehrlichia mikurensis]QXK92343.1 ribosome-binding factor A [Neoehrlichia mikurensis]QXK93188.1 ribosome-binding factor A [Neoehrlichia mikurensis]QXK94038.1 ribosome-binding factor A [Neoehrlichia mikurensis]UTO55344.1 ribosome-binding factor A [Neoehrlichia mikurensis]UTO56265.1 ribosome-binding factor A [Neoehrlichia mikurensis]